MSSNYVNYPIFNSANFSQGTTYVTLKYLLDNYYTNNQINSLLADYVKLDTAQTITGQKSFSQAILPTTNNGSDVGSTGFNFNNGYFNNLYANNTIISVSESQNDPLYYLNQVPPVTGQNYGIIGGDFQSSASVTSIVSLTNVCAIVSSLNPGVGNTITLYGLTSHPEYNGIQAVVVSSSGVLFTFNFTHADFIQVAETGNAVFLKFSSLVFDQTSNFLRINTNTLLKPVATTIYTQSNGTLELGSIQLDGSTSGSVTLAVPSAPTSFTITLPSAKPTVNGTLTTTNTGGVQTYTNSNATIDGSGNLLLLGNAGITGNTSLNTLTVTGTTILSNTLTVTGASNFASTLGVSGNTSLNTLTVTGTVNVYGASNFVSRIGVGFTGAIQNENNTLLQLGNLSSAIDGTYLQSMGTVYFRMREISASNQMRLSTNENTTNTPDDITFPGWCMYMGNDAWKVTRFPANSGVETTMVNTDNVGNFNALKSISISSTGSQINSYQTAQYTFSGTGTIGGTFGGMTGTATITKLNNDVKISWPAIQASQGNGLVSQVMTLTPAIPSQFFPGATAASGIIIAQDNGSTVFGRADISTAGVITFGVNANKGNFSSTGTCGIKNCVSSYSVV